MTVSRFPNGINTAVDGSTLWEYPAQDPTKVHAYFNDFDTYVAGDWTVTADAGGSQALANEDGGVLLITNDGDDNDGTFYNLVGESFLFQTGKQLWFKIRFKVSDATQIDWVCGLQITDTTPLAVTDGVFFQSDDGDANIDFHVEKDSTATTETAVATHANDTYMTLGFYYNGGTGTDGRIYAYKDDAQVGSAVITNMPDDEALTISFGSENGEAAAKIMSVDYVFAAKER